MEEGAEKEAVLASLNTSYNEQRLAAAREYAQTLAQLVNPVWNDEGMQREEICGEPARPSRAHRSLE